MRTLKSQDNFVAEKQGIHHFRKVTFANRKSVTVFVCPVQVTQGKKMPYFFREINGYQYCQTFQFYEKL